MRIRRCASRLLGSAFSAAPAPRFDDLDHHLAPPLPHPPLYPAAPESSSSAGAASVYAVPPPAAASGEPCELSRSPWDLIGELDLSDPQEDLVGKYFVSVACRAGWLFPASMSAAAAAAAVKKEAHDGSGRPRGHGPPKKPGAKKPAVKKEKKESSEPKKKVKVKKEEDCHDDGEAAGGVGPQVWMCKKNDGKRWHCHRQVTRPNALCDYHVEQKRAYYNPASDSASEGLPSPLLPPPPPALSKPAPKASKPSTSSKPRRKKLLGDAGEGFYYYAGFGPFRSKRHCRSSSSMQELIPVKHEVDEEEAPPAEDHAAPAAGQAQAYVVPEHPQPAACDESSVDDIAGIAGGDEESSDDNGDYPLGCNNGAASVSQPRAAGMNGDGMRKITQWKKRWRKPVKARSLKSLM